MSAPQPPDSPAALDEWRWQQVLQRRPLAPEAGTFVYAVKTTGTYARPGAAARLPRRSNVVFFDTAAAAQAAGYRPSQHAPLPGDRHAPLIAEICRWLEQQEQPPTLGEMARQAGMSPHHFHRTFKATTGLTPKAYTHALQAHRLAAELATGQGSVTAAVLASGFGASSSFYDHSTRWLGMRASEYQAGGARQLIHFAVARTSLGALLVARSARGLCAITLGDDPETLVHQLERQFSQAQLLGGDPDFESWVAQVIGLIEAPQTGCDLPLDLQGTTFQRRVWHALQKIPPGHTVSYAELARAIGQPTAVRAVARACASNSLAVAIPCHRVVRSDGTPSGYRWGIERKTELLKREQAATHG